jgi:hypothetical protein
MRLGLSVASVCLAAVFGLEAHAGFTGTDIFIPAVARADGQAGARFYSTLWVTNLSETTADVTFDLLLQGRANPSPETRREAIQPGATRRIDDVVGSYFGNSGAGAAIRIRSDKSVFASSRTYSQPIGTDLKDVVGLFFTGIPASFAISLGETSALQGISNGPPESYRYNFGLVETSGQSATVAVTVRDEYGTPIGSAVQYSLGGYEARQVNAFAGFPVTVSTRNGRLDVTVTSGLGKVITYGTLVAGTPENPGSNDSIGFEMSFRNLLAGAVQSVNGLTGAVRIQGSSTATVTTAGDGSITISGVQGSGAGLPAGQINQTLRHDGSAWVSSSALLNDGSRLEIAGDILKAGSRFLSGSGGGNLTVGLFAGGVLTASQTAVGQESLYANRTGGSNTAIGYRSLYANANGNTNTAIGARSLESNTSGGDNVAVGVQSMVLNTTGMLNTAVGRDSLFMNNSGSYNTALGVGSLALNTTGEGNTASGSYSMNGNVIGRQNAAYGERSLSQNSSGNFNTAIGAESLLSATGSENIAIGWTAGYNLAAGDGNIYIGSMGIAGDNYTIRIGDSGRFRTFVGGIRGVPTGESNGIPVLIDAKGQLGTASSSVRFKDDIQDMKDVTSGLLRLRPVTFRYKGRPNIIGERHYGLVAEEVNEVYPELVARSADGEIETVKYQELPAMLLNELQRMATRSAEVEWRLQNEIQGQAREIEALRLRVEELLNGGRATEPHSDPR